MTKRQVKSKRRPSAKPKLLNDPRHTAYHEASHAVTGRVLTLVCAGVSIEPDFEAGEAGSAIIGDHYTCPHEWERRGKLLGTNDAVLHGRIIAYAGRRGRYVLTSLTEIIDREDAE